MLAGLERGSQTRDLNDHARKSNGRAPVNLLGWRGLPRNATDTFVIIHAKHGEGSASWVSNRDQTSLFVAYGSTRADA